jgi:hypothetical protein
MTKPPRPNNFVYALVTPLKTSAGNWTKPALRRHGEDAFEPHGVIDHAPAASSFPLQIRILRNKLKLKTETFSRLSLAKSLRGKASL